LKRVLFDHNVPSPLQRFLRGHDVKLADHMGWAKLNNGELLDVAEAAGFEVLLSGDKTMRHEQQMAGRKIALAYRQSLANREGSCAGHRRSC
jgi:hypothetical protein